MRTSPWPRSRTSSSTWGSRTSGSCRCGQPDILSSRAPSVLTRTRSPRAWTGSCARTRRAGSKLSSASTRTKRPSTPSRVTASNRSRPTTCIPISIGSRSSTRAWWDVNVEAQDFVLTFPNQLDRQIIELECAHDPNFEAEIVELLQQPDGMTTIINSAQKAIINDIDPGTYPEMEGAWPMLRNIARDIYDKISRTSATPGTYGSPGGLSDLGQDFSGIITAIAPLLGTLAGAGASVYAAEQQ